MPAVFSVTSRRRRVSGVAMIVATLLQILVQAMPVAASITPSTDSMTIAPGGSDTRPLTVNIPAVPPKADILIAIDTTGSMGPAIVQATADAEDIVDAVQLAVDDSQFAVVDFKDSSDGANEYRLRQPLTDDATLVSNAIGAMTATGGGDAPEAHNLVFKNSYDPDPGAIGWRPGAKKIVVVISDAEPHDAGDVVPDLPGCADSIADPHGLNTNTVLAGMDAADRTLIMVLYDTGSGTTLQCYESIAERTTGGIAADGTDGLGEQIIDLINTTFTADVANVHVEVAATSPAAAQASWVSFDPPFRTNVARPSDAEFPVTVNVPLGTASGDYVFDLVAMADNVDIGHQTLTVHVEPAVTLNAPQLLGVMPLAGNTLYSGLLTGDPDTTYDVDFFTTNSCVGGVPGPVTPFGSTIEVETDEFGTGVFNDGFSATTPTGTYAVARSSADGGQSGYSNCVLVGPANDNWARALSIPLTGGSGSVNGIIDQPGQGRWYKFEVQPGQRITVTLTNLPKDYDLALFTDIGQAYNSLVNPANNTDLTKLGVEFAGTAFSGTAFSGTAFSGTAFSGTAFSGTAFSGTAFSGTAFSGTAFSGTAFSGTAFSGTAFSGTAFSGTAFSGTAFLPEAFSAAVSRSVVVASANPGTGSESATANTWNNTGSFYVAVMGKNGVSDFDNAFTVSVSQSGGDCGSVAPSSLQSPDPISGSYRTIILTDSDRLANSGNGSDLDDALTAFKGRGDVDGVVVDLADDPKVQDLNDQADDHPTCVYAKNLVAEAIRDVVESYRDDSPNLTNVVILGNDDVIPFFRNPDRSDIAQESAYDPPVDDDTASQASLRGNYVLSQDAYGAAVQISQYSSTFAIPDLAVGRLVETASEITGMLEAYIDTDGVVSPESSLVTGYDFLTDAANQAQADLEAGTGGANSDSLINPGDWTADELREQLLDNRHDIAFLAGHFSSSAALAGDFETTLTTTDLVTSTTDLSNVVVFSIGCHSGYNLVDDHAVPGVTQPLDWAQAFAQKGMTGVLGTGYQYGDTDFIAYSEQLYTNLIHGLRVGTGPVSIGRALVNAKLDYLRDVPDLRGLHEKVLREATLFGLPMLKIDLPQGRGLSAHPNAATLGGVAGYPANTAGGQLGLQSRTFDVFPDLDVHNKTLDVDGGGTIETTWYSGPNGIVTNPGEPALPLVSEGVGLTGSVLRGVGFLGGDYDDSSVVPLTGAPGTEANGVHTAFTSPTFFPSKLWTANYYEALSIGGAGTRLLITPAQHQSTDPSDPNVTLRKYENLHLRLFYSSSTADGAGSDAPTITAVTATVVGNTVQFSARVVGDPRAGVQETWITYTGLTDSWQSIQLTQSATDSALWTGSLNVGTLPSTLTELDFMVQAVNGFGLVGRNDNLGAYHKVFLLSGGAPTPVASSLTVTVPGSGAFGSTGTFSADLNAPNQSGQTIRFTLGGVSLYAVTNGSGVASVDFPLNLSPGSHPVSASFLGSPTALGSSTTASININQTATSLVVGSNTADYLTETGVTATLTAFGGSALAGRTVIFGVSGPGGSATVPAMTDPQGIARLGAVNLPVGTYDVTADFAGDSEYTGSPQADGSLTITQATGSVSITNIPVGAVFLGSFTPTYSALGDGATSATSSTPLVCTVAGTLVNFVGVGTCTLTAHVAAGTNHEAADGAPQSFSVGQASQTIAFGAAPTNATVGGSGSVSALATSGLAVTFGSSTLPICTVNPSSGALTLLAVGTCTITADQAGNANWLAAAQQTQSFDVAAQPTATSVNPPSIGRGAITFPVTVNGTGFAPGSTVAISGAGVTINTTQYVSPTRIDLTVSVATNAATGNRNVTVNVPGAAATVCTGCLNVNQGPYGIAAVPLSIGQGAVNETVTVVGFNFVAGTWTPASVQFSGTGITVNSVTRVNSLLLNVNLTVASNAPTGARSVTVINPDGGRTTALAAFTVNAAPTIGTISPNSRAQGASNQTIVINGTGFRSGTWPPSSVSFGADVTTNSVTRNSAGTQLSVNISVAQSATLGPRDVTIRNTDGGRATKAAGFSVTAGPTITSVTPNSRGQGAANQAIAIGGTFAAGTWNSSSVSFSGTGITVSAVTRNAAGTQLTVTISVASTAPTGARTLTVRNPDGGTASSAFTVNARPTVSSVAPNSKARGQTTSVVINGTFAQGTWTPAMVAFSGGGITVNSVSVNLAGTQLTVSITIAGNASRSQRNVTVTNPDGGNHTLSNGFRVT